LSSIGKLVAEYVKPFGARISFYDPTIDNFPDNLTRYGSLEELFANNDIVSIHAGLNNYTRSSVDYSLLSKLPYGGILINTARGPIVVEKDLGKILMEGKIRAGIDVSEYESDFRLSPYMSCPNTTITSHAISKIGSLEKTILQEIAFDNLGRFAKSEKPVHVVTMRRYEMMT
jgi:glycerate dehydrogenase